VSKYRAYSVYKDSGVELIGDIPEHWDSVSLRWISKRYSGGTPDKSNDDYWHEGTIPWLNSGAVNQQVITEPSTHITEEAFKNSSAKWIPENSVLIALAGQGKTKGMVGYTTFQTTCNQSMAAIVFEDYNPKFMFWWLTSQYKNIRGLASDDGRDGLNLEMIGSIPCPIFDKKEQEQIANYLDHETQKIDDMIKTVKQVITTLQEYRTALITAAVTGKIDVRTQTNPSAIDAFRGKGDGGTTTRLLADRQQNDENFE
jgi:type I restriction enzyme S subunit